MTLPTPAEDSAAETALTHWLVVSADEPGFIDPHPFEIEHPDCTLVPGDQREPYEVETDQPDGTTTTVTVDPGRYPDQYECRVEVEALNAGIDAFFVRAGDAPTGWRPEALRPGRYLIEVWEETYRGHEFTEYDSGLRLVYPDEAQPTT